jgi:hypothetical protein
MNLFLSILIFIILNSIKIDTACLQKLVSDGQESSPCNIRNNVKGIINKEYHVEGFDITDNLDACCEKCRNHANCQVFGYFDSTNLCVYLSGLIMNDIIFEANEGTHFGAPNF